MATNEQRRDWIRISLCDGVRPETWLYALETAKAADVDPHEFLTLSHLQRERTFHTPEGLERALQQHPGDTKRIDQLLDALDRHDIWMIPAWDEHYPDVVRQCMGAQAPPVLYCWGDRRILSRAALAMVGASEASASGLTAAQAYAEAVAARKIAVVSGLARGIDTASHQGALAADEGATIAVLPHGILRLAWPDELAGDADPSRVLAVSSWPPDHGWESRYAVERNKLIVALSDGVFAVETGLTGGTTYSVREARRTHKPLMTLEYAKGETPPSAVGNHSLRALGARMLPVIQHAAEAPLQGLLEDVDRQYKCRKSGVPWGDSGRADDAQGELF
ncbi:DNA-processing protein DprA [Candidatus Sumerlaeota bacterium]|nr:DNA-processing protein DprA [Candidatus Sumerlaeota bacterium]